MSKQTPKTPNPAAQALGRLGGAKNSPAQVAARLANAKLAGRPRRICNDCGKPVYGGHKDRKQDAVCQSTGWRWQKPSERRAEKKPRAAHASFAKAFAKKGRT